MTENKEAKKATTRHVSEVILLQLTLFHVHCAEQARKRRGETSREEQKREEKRVEANQSRIQVLHKAETGKFKTATGEKPSIIHHFACDLVHLTRALTKGLSLRKPYLT